MTKVAREEILAALPPRRREAHKGDFGRVLIAAGSPGMMGAAILCTGGALRSGSGLVSVACLPSWYAVIHGTFPEAMCQGPIHDPQEVAAYDSVVLGPGRRPSEETGRELSFSLAGSRGALIVDAGGLMAAANWDLPLKSPGGQVILTPHEGEAASLLGLEAGEVAGDREQAIRRLVEATGAICVLKGRETLVLAPGSRLYRNATGNPGMAAGGCGDVLAGVLAALTARAVREGRPLWNSVLAGVYLHGLAGDLACQALGEHSMKAGDIVDKLPQAFLITLET